MAIRDIPVKPYNTEELALIAERQLVVRDRLLVTYSVAVGLSTLGSTAGWMSMDRELKLGRLTILDSGAHLLNRKVWRALAWELRIAPGAWVARATGADALNSDMFYMSNVQADGGINSAGVSYLPSLAPVSDIDVLKWLGIAGGEIGYAGHHDPHWTPIGDQERIGDVAAEVDAKLTNFATIDVRGRTTVFWFKTGVGLAWHWLQEQPASVSVTRFESGGLSSTRSLDTDTAIEWVRAALAKWSTASRFRTRFDVPTVVPRLNERRFVDVETLNGRGMEYLTVAIPAATWDVLSTTTYAAALAEGRKVT